MEAIGTLKRTGTFKTLDIPDWQPGHEKMYALIQREGGDRTSREWSNLYAARYGGSYKTASKFVRPLADAGYLVSGTIGYKLKED